MEPVKGGSLASFNEKIENKMKKINPNASIASWAFRWVGSLPNVRIILSGMSNIEQLEDNIHTFKNFEPLNEEEQEIISSVRKDLLSLSKVPCTSCNYCMPCSYGVDIPGNFRIYNHHSMYQSEKYTTWALENLDKKEAFADVCVSCGECLPKCPQNIDIPNRLADFENYVKENGLK